MTARWSPDGQLLSDDGTVSEPRAAATVIVLRGGAEALELLLVRRTPAARFMAGVWVFPGGAVDPGDGAGEAALRAAARREAREEAGIEIADELVAFSRWITPAEVKIRFDTWFFLAEVLGGQTPKVDGSEIVAARWETPGGALAAHARGELPLVLPTISHLEELARFRSARELLAGARGRDVHPVQPRIVGSGEEARIELTPKAGAPE